MSFQGFYALAFYTFFIGILIPSPRQTDIVDFSIGLIARSLYVSWSVVVVSFLFGLPSLLFVLTLAVVARASFSAAEIPIPKGHDRRIAIFALLCVGQFLVVLLLGGFDRAYHPIFAGWDPVVSWNRWAVELAENAFRPYNAAYPILFPGIWSLIYKAQGSSEVWIIAKYSLLLLPILLCAPAIKLFSQRRFASLALYLTVCAYLFLSSNLAHVFDGNMDMPVAIMILVSTVWLGFSIGNNDALDPGALATAVTLSGLAALTKQAGVLVLVPALYLILIGLLSRQLSIRQAFYYMALALMPVTTFIAMLLLSGGALTGNLNYLQTLAASASKDHSQMFSAISLLVSAVTPYLSILLIAFALLNVVSLRRMSGQLGTILAAMAVVGFMIFANCCSYDVRNGWWVFSFLAGSSISAMRKFDDIVVRGQHSDATASIILKPIFIICLALVAIVSLAVSKFETAERLVARQYYYQSQILPPEMGKGLEASKHLLGVDGRVISAVQPIRWFPGFADKYELCHHTDTDCVRRLIKAHPSSIVIVSREAESLFYKGFSDQLTSDKLIGIFGSYEFYGPYS